MGMSFNDATLSPINAQLEIAYGDGTTMGHSPISNILDQNSSAPNCFDVLLDRSSDLDDTSTGTLLIGEHLPQYASITEKPQLSRQSPGRWTAGMDGMTVNGQVIPLPASGTTVALSGQLVMLLDTGYSLPPLPQSLVDAIYSTVPGAVQSTEFSGLQWLLPCTSATNVTFQFA